MTHVDCGRDGWGHLTAVIDCHDREIVGWEFSLRGRAKEAEMAIESACEVCRLEWDPFWERDKHAAPQEGDRPMRQGRHGSISTGVGPLHRLRVKQRLKVVRYTLATSVKAASRHFGLDRKTVRRWRDLYQAGGEVGLVPRYPRHRARRIPQAVIDLMVEARREHGYGPLRTKIWLERVHKITASDSTIGRIMRDLGIPRAGRPMRRRLPRQLKLFQKDRPGESVQADVKVVRVVGRKCFQYTAIDDCTRFRVLRLSPSLDQRASISFISEIMRAFPFAIEKIQTDRGTEFSLAFVLRLRELGIKHRYIRPRRPQQNGKVERSHRTDSEEFWGRRSFKAFSEAVPQLAAWERAYNDERFSLALGGRTPSERLRDFLPVAA